jgi:sterol 14-demethylase
VSGLSLIKVVHVFIRKGLKAMIYDQQRALGSVFTISFFGVNITFLVGPEVLDHFYQGLESDISHGKTLEFMVPMLGKEVGFGVDVTTRNEQMRFHNDALKLSKLRSHIDPMVQEVEVSSIK